MRQLITTEDVLKLENIIFVDVRSKAEFTQTSIPGAVNIPLFTEEERHELGITYKGKGPAEARMLGLEIVSKKLPALVREVLEVSEGKTPVLYCWRGGSRSESVAAILEVMHIPVFRLKGGYKGFRRYVHQQLEHYALKTEVVVLHGLTGVGKTRILHLLRKDGYPILDLEGLARHRGSVFGSLGLLQPHSQKDFESFLWWKLEEHRHEPYLLVEGEGKKIGPIFVPQFLTEKMEAGHHLLLKAPMEVRVDRILVEYVDKKEEIMAGAREALKYLTSRLGKKKVDALISLVDAGKLREVIRELCIHYYDKLYQDSRKRDDFYNATIDATDLHQAVEGIKAYLKGIKKGGSLNGQ